MTTEDLSPGLPLPPAIAETAKSRGVWTSLDARFTRYGEWLNPILVKECRQALKSWQFVITFGILLAAVWFWSFCGLAMYGPTAKYRVTGPTMFVGYYLILALPLLVVVPFGAFRSLAGEFEDRTFELVSITTLRPRQIVLGKIGSALVQILIYLSAVSPCLAFTYLLRGINILSLVVVLGYISLLACGLSLIALLVATMASEKHWQTVLSVILLVLLFVCCWGVCIFVTKEVDRDVVAATQADTLPGHGMILTLYASYFVLLVQATAARLTFASDNRSTPQRVTLVAQQLLFFGWVVYLCSRNKDRFIAGLAMDDLLIFSTIAGIHWFFVGGMFLGERPELSRRVKRRLPQTVFERVFLTWFNPGSGTGYMFLLCNLAVIAATLIVVSYTIPNVHRTHWPRVHPTIILAVQLRHFALFGFCYFASYLGLARLTLIGLRRRGYTSVLLAVLMPLLWVLIGTSVPLVIYGMAAGPNDEYSLLQFTNPFWTLAEAVHYSRNMPDAHVLCILLPVVTCGIFLANFPSIARECAQTRDESM